MQKKTLWIMIVLIILSIVLLIFWFMPRSSVNQAQQVNNEPSQHAAPSHTITSGSSAIAPNQIFSSKSQQDTEVNCQLRLDQSNTLIVNQQTRDCFEYFITQYGEKELTKIDQDFQAYIQQGYKDPALKQILDLWQRYLKYRQSLADIQAPNIDKESSQYFSAIFNLTEDLRKKHFSDYEIEGLFGTENTYHLYTIQRIKVLEDKRLTENEKAQKLKELFNQLPEDWKENLEQINKLDDLRKLTAEIKGRGGSNEEIHQMRLSLVGAEATQRLENLDVQRNDWKNRVNHYLTERDNIVKSNMSESAKQKAVQQLRQQNFNSPTEQLRLDTFETVHDRGEKLPFAE